MEKKEKKPNFFVRAGKAIGRYFKEVVGEVKKLSWPTKKELINYCLAVLACVALVAAITWGHVLGLGSGGSALAGSGKEGFKLCRTK